MAPPIKLMPKTIEAVWAPLYAELAADYLDRLPRGEIVDLFPALAGPLAARLLAHAMGIPDASDDERLLRFVAPGVFDERRRDVDGPHLRSAPRDLPGIGAVTATDARIEKTKAYMWVVLARPSTGLTKNDLYWAMVSTSVGPPRWAGGSFGWKLSTTM